MESTARVHPTLTQTQQDIDHQINSEESKARFLSYLEKGNYRKLREECIRTHVNANYNGRRPIHIASSLGNVKVVKTLVEHNADLTKADSNGKTPLQLAIDGNHQELVRYLQLAKPSKTQVVILTSSSENVVSRTPSPSQPRRASNALDPSTLDSDLKALWDRLKSLDARGLTNQLTEKQLKWLSVCFKNFEAHENFSSPLQQFLYATIGPSRKLEAQHEKAFNFRIEDMEVHLDISLDELSVIKLEAKNFVYFTQKFIQSSNEKYLICQERNITGELSALLISGRYVEDQIMQITIKFNPNVILWYFLSDLKK